MICINIKKDKFTEYLWMYKRRIHRYDEYTLKT